MDEKYGFFDAVASEDNGRICLADCPLHYCLWSELESAFETGDTDAISFLQHKLESRWELLGIVKPMLKLRDALKGKGNLDKARTPFSVDPFSPSPVDPFSLSSISPLSPEVTRFRTIDKGNVDKRHKEFVCSIKKEYLCTNLKITYEKE